METRMLTPLGRLWRLIALDRTDITVVYLYALFNGLVNLSLPLGIQAIINLIVGGQVSTSWLVLVGIVITGIALAGWMQIMQLRITENIQQKIFTRSAFEFAWRIPRMKLEALDKYYPPELVNRFFDTMMVQKGISKILIDFSTASLQVVIGMVLLSFYHPFFILFSIILILLVLLIFFLTGRPGLRTSLKESSYKYEVAHWLEELARAVVSVKLAGKSVLPLAQTDRLTEEYLKARNAHFRVLMIQYMLMVLFKVFVAAALLLVGGWLVIRQQMNIGQFVAAEIIIILVMSSVEKLILSLQTIYDILTSLEKIGTVTELAMEQEGEIHVPLDSPERGLRIGIHDLTFSFPDSPRPVIQDLHLDIQPGERLAIVGYNGSGKSTLLRLLAGLYEDFQGMITYNGIPLSNLDKEHLRSMVGNSIAEDEIFEGTLLENITVGREDVSLMDVKNAIEAVGLNAFIKTMPAGYQTLLGTQGRKLPRSIIQRLILARCIVVRPRLILLEDWLGRIEHTDRQYLKECLFHPEAGWTIVSNTNNPDFAREFDRIAVMKDGRIAALGTWEELRDNPYFKAVFQST